jgi:hypothetical protein
VPYGAPTPYGARQPYNAQADPTLRFLMPINVSPWAIAAGYLGLCSLLCVFGPLAIIAAVLAIGDIKKNNKGGIGRAYFGLVMGILGTGMLLWLIMSGSFSSHG